MEGCRDGWTVCWLDGWMGCFVCHLVLSGPHLLMLNRDGLMDRWMDYFILCFDLIQTGFAVLSRAARLGLGATDSPTFCKRIFKSKFYSVFTAFTDGAQG